MARPRLKGDTIPVQLPLDVDRDVRARAEAEQTSVGAYLANLVCRAFVASELGEAAAAVQHASNTRTKARKPAGNRIDSDEADGNASTGIYEVRIAACEHRNRVPISGGMARCRDCGAMRDVRGQWKVVH